MGHICECRAAFGGLARWSGRSPTLTRAFAEGCRSACAQSNPPDPAKLRMDDIMGITVILLTCSYNGKVRPAGKWQSRRP